MRHQSASAKPSRALLEMGRRPLLQAVFLALVTVVLAASDVQSIAAPAPPTGDAALGLEDVLALYPEVAPDAVAEQRLEAIVAAAREDARDRARTVEARRTALAALLVARRALVVAASDATGRVARLADLGTEILYEAMAMDALGATVLYGLPGDDERRQFTALVSELDEVARLAADAVDAAIRQVESAPQSTSDPEAQRARRHLIDVERDRRIAFLRGVADALAGRIATDPAERRRRAVAAQRRLEPLDDRLDGAVAARARLHLGLALVDLGDARAAGVLASVIADDTAAEQDRIAARLATCAAMAASGEVAAARRILLDAANDDVLAASIIGRLLAADLVARIALAANDGEARSDRFDGYLALVAAPPPPLDDRTIRALVFDRLVRAAHGAPSASGLPPLVAIAVAERRASDDDGAADATLHLEQVLDRSELSEDERVLALMTLGRVHHRAGALRAAADAFGRVAREHPGDPNATRAAELAASLALSAHRATPDDPAARNTLRAALDRVLQHYPEVASIDTWRFAAGLLAIDEARWDDAAAALAAVSAEADRYAEAIFRLGRLERDRIDAASETVDPARLEAALAALRRAIRRLAAIDAVSARPLEARLYVDVSALLARLHRIAEAGEALRAAESVGADDRTVRTEIARRRVEQHRAEGRHDLAAAALRSFGEYDAPSAEALLVDMVRERIDACDELIGRGDDAAARELARSSLMPLAELLDGVLQEHDLLPRDAAHRWQLVADGFLRSGEAGRALAIYDDLLVLQPTSVRLVIGKADALRGLGGPSLADAMPLYRRVAVATADRDDLASFYWFAQLRLLQVLDESGRGTDQIVPRIRRLQQEDPELGGDRYQRHFMVLLQRHAN